MARFFIFFGAINGLLSVALGAFGAHALKSQLSANLLTTYQTASTYQATHALGLILVGILLLQRPSPWLKWAGWALLVGVLLFCGSLYTLALTGIRPIGMVTPFGGIAFMVGWLCLCIAAWRMPYLDQ